MIKFCNCYQIAMLSYTFSFLFQDSHENNAHINVQTFNWSRVSPLHLKKDVASVFLKRKMLNGASSLLTTASISGSHHQIVHFSSAVIYVVIDVHKTGKKKILFFKTCLAISGFVSMSTSVNLWKPQRHGIKKKNCVCICIPWLLNIVSVIKVKEVIFCTFSSKNMVVCSSCLMTTLQAIARATAYLSLH